MAATEASAGEFELVFPEDERRRAFVRCSSGRAEPQLDGLSQLGEMRHGTEENYTGAVAR